MGLLRDLFKIKTEEDVFELPQEETEGQKRHVLIRLETLRDFVDIDRVARLLKEGNIVFLKTKDLQRKDIGEFQNCAQKLRKVCTQYGFDLVGTEEGYFVLTPSFARIIR